VQSELMFVRPNDVWIVFHDENEAEELIGVFRTSEDADKYADEVSHEYTNGVIIRSYEFG
jgi:hypothetical protein